MNLKNYIETRWKVFSRKKITRKLKSGGEQKNYAHIVYGEECAIDELVADIEKFSALSEPDFRGVVVALENTIQGKFSNGRIVRLEKLGRF